MNRLHFYLSGTHNILYIIDFQLNREFPFESAFFFLHEDPYVGTRIVYTENWICIFKFGQNYYRHKITCNSPLKSVFLSFCLSFFLSVFLSFPFFYLSFFCLFVLFGIIIRLFLNTFIEPLKVFKFITLIT